jgi:hypothetical protein
MPDGAPLARLFRDGLLTDDGSGPRTTARFQAAMARAALRLQRSGAPWQDLRVPIAAALVELCGDLSDADVATCVEALLPIEQAAFGPLFRDSPRPGAP